jgi:hypothetical protein
MELRFTYDLDTAFKQISLEKRSQYLKGIVYDEIMINGGTKLSKIPYQNRAYVAVQLGLSPAVALELEYLNSFFKSKWEIILIETLYDSVSFIRLKIIQIRIL